MNLKKLIQISLITVFVSLIGVSVFSQSVIDKFSYSSCFVIGQYNSRPLFSGTCFFVRINKKIYLITNNHVVSGKFAIDEYKRIHKHEPPVDSVANNLKVRVYSKSIGNFFFLSIPIKTIGKDAYIKFWEDSKSTELMDVVAIELSDALSIQLDAITIYDESYLNDSLLLVPSTDLFILGFPNSFAFTSLYPIWKRGTIASEPNLSDYGDTKFWIDATTKHGMSGSPVIFRGTTFMDKQNTLNVAGLTTFLVGIYSAQDSVNDIGLVWKLKSVFNDLKKR